MKKKTTSTKSIKSVSKSSKTKTVSKATSKRGPGRPKGSKNKKRPEPVSPSGVATVSDMGVVVSHPAEVPSTTSENSTARR